jgi:endonuclease-3
METPKSLSLTPEKRAQIVDAFLEKTFPNPKIPLHHKDPYTLLIAVLLSARCLDSRVNEITPFLFEKADNPYAMAKLSIESVQTIIRPCGLSPAKAKAIVGLSKVLIEKHNGQVPETLEMLETLPGVGHKTASVVIVQAFNKPAFPVDTHIHRLAQMWGLTSGKNVKQTEVDLKKLFPETRWNKLHLQMIHYGREICPAKGCNRLRSPLCQLCFPKNTVTFKAKLA